MIAKSKLSSIQRREHIRKLLTRNSSVSIGELSRLFTVSEMTVRRDLNQLASSEEVRRTHGGAVMAERLVLEFDYRSRRQAERAAKQAIARKALEFVKPGQRIILDTGTTTLELARLLKQFDGLTIVTPSLAVASEVQFSDKLEVVLLGGIMRRGNPDLTGPVTEYCLEMFAVDIAFLGADAIGSDGSIYNSDVRLAQVDRKMRRQATSTYILADATKLDRTEFCCNGNLGEVQALITDERISPQLLRTYRREGFQIIKARL